MTENIVQGLFERYGTRAKDVARYLHAAGVEPLSTNPGWTRQEVEFLVEHEKVLHMEDLLLRRSTLAWLGQVSLPLVDELSGIMGAKLGWTTDQKMDEKARTLHVLAEMHGVNL